MLKRLLLEVPAELESPLYLGSLEDVVYREEVDNPDVERRGKDRKLATNAAGKFVLRGSSIAGACKAACSRNLRRAWGDVDNPSLISVDDVVLNVPRPDKRVGNAIDRYTRTVTDSSFYQYQVIPRGTRFSLTLRSDCRTKEEEDIVRRAFDELADLIHSGLIHLGGRKNVGWGKIRISSQLGEVSECRVFSADLNSIEGIYDWINEKSYGKSIVPKKILDDRVLHITLEWSPTQAVLVGKQHEFGQQDESYSNVIEPLVDADGCATLPGSSIRGAFRAHLSRIVNTILQLDHDNWQGLATHEQISSEAKIIRRIFGTSQNAGAIHVDDSHTSSRNLAYLKRDHISIDRWTGGIIDGERGNHEDNIGGHLFSTVAVANKEWTPITFEVRLERLGNDDEQRAALCLISIGLAEIVTGYLSLGGSTTRGYGQIDVHGVIWSVSSCSSKDYFNFSVSDQEAGNVSESISNFRRRDIASKILLHAKDIEPSTGWVKVIESIEKIGADYEEVE